MQKKSFLQANYPELAAIADRMEQEVQQLENSLRSCKSKKEANQIYIDTKMRLMSSVNKNDSSALAIMSAIDKTFAEYEKE